MYLVLFAMNSLSEALVYNSSKMTFSYQSLPFPSYMVEGSLTLTNDTLKVDATVRSGTQFVEEDTARYTRQ